MATFDKNQILVGIAKVYINGELVGYTTEDGVSQEFSGDTLKVRAAEALGTLANYRTSREQQLKWAFMQLNPTNLKQALGLAADVAITGTGTSADPYVIPLKYSVELPTFNVLFVVNAGANSLTLTYETTVQPIENGALIFKKTDPTAIEATFEEIMDANTNTFGTYRQINATGTALTVSSSVPADNSTGVDESAQIDVTFSEAIAAQSLTTSNFTLVNITTGAATPVTVAYKPSTPGDAVVRISPVSAMTSAASYVLVISDRVLSITGKSLGTPYLLNFSIAS